MSAIDRVDQFQQRHTWASFPFAVFYKFFDDQGVYLAALITYYGFLSLFPILLLLSSILGFVLQNDPDLQHQILQTAVSQFPVIGKQLGDPQGLQGSTPAVIVGALIALYGALGIAQALQNAMNVCWAVPRHLRPNPIRLRLRSMLLIASAGLVLIGTTVLSAIGRSADSYGVGMAGAGSLVLTLMSVMLNALVFVLALRISTAHPLNFRESLPGAIAAAVGWQLLQSFGTLFVGRVIRNSSDTYGVFALVLGLLGWILVAAIVVVISVEINVVWAKRLYPRALLTPFTDDVDLTPADQLAYTDSAVSMRFKGFQHINVTFDHEGQNASAIQALEAGDEHPDNGTEL